MMNSINCIIVLILRTFTIATAPPIDIVFIIQTQEIEYHSKLSQNLKENIIKQSIELQPNYSIKVHLLNEIFNYPGGWTIHYLIPQLMLFQSKNNRDTNTNELKDEELINDNTRWIIFCEEKTKVKVKLLIERLNQENHTQPLYLGYPLYDHEPTIIHHFAFFENPKWFPYPMIRAGVVFSGPLLKSIADIYANRNSKMFKQQFSIDAGHELARFIYDNIRVPLTTLTTSRHINENVNALHSPSSHTRSSCTTHSKATTPTTDLLQGTETTHVGVSIAIDATHAFDVSHSDFCSLTSNENEIVKPVGNTSTNTTTKTSFVKKQKIILKLASYICSLATWENSSRSSTNNSNNNKSCAMYAEHIVNPAPSMPCTPVQREEIYFAIKTCSRYHSERLPIIQATWTPHAKHVKYFSDVEDHTIPTTNTGVPNVEMGHCTKTLQILKLALKDIEDYNRQSNRGKDKNLQIKWLFLSDDDTLLSVSGVCQVLGCYNSMDKIYLGERYGYRLFAQDGFNYITGGGGIVFSLPVVKLILQHCTCPSSTSPDDMILGSCLHSLQLTALHSPRFHQARPNDYPMELLKQEPPVSFHKFWQVDAVDVYKRWFAPLDHKLFTDRKNDYKEPHNEHQHFKERRILAKTETLNLNKIPVSVMTSLSHSKERHVDL